MTGHTLDLLHCSRTRQEPVAPFEQGHRATTIGNVADITVRLGRKLRWDWETETFHLKDLDDFGVRGANDVIWGQGKGRVADILAGIGQRWGAGCHGPSAVLVRVVHYAADE